jgi:hypothetical protein
MYEEGVVIEGMGFSSDLDFRQMRVGPGSIRSMGGPEQDSTAVRDSIGAPDSLTVADSSAGRDSIG